MNGNNLKMYKYLLRVFLVLASLSILSGTDSYAQNNGKKNYSIVIIGDTQHMGFWEGLYPDYWGEHNEAKTRQLFGEIARRQPAFVIHLGDITRDGSKGSAWEEFDADSKPTAQKNIPFYPVFGNHEYFGSSSEMYKYFYSHFPAANKRKWYSFVYNGTGIILINTNFSRLSENETAEQRTWYQSELKRFENDPSVKRIVVAGHHPPYTNSTIVDPSKTVEKDFGQPFIKSRKGTFFFSGHCHSYERFNNGGKNFIVSGGGGGPRQKLDVDKSKRSFNDLFQGPSVRFFHFCEIQILGDSLSFCTVRLNDDGTFSETDRLNIP